jgi:DNA-binding response OmpR family regulator
MLSAGRKSCEVRGTRVPALLHPPRGVVEVRRSGISIPYLVDSERILRVLVVDDNEDAADSLSMVVNLWGADAQVAYDGEEALEMALVQRPDVVLLDLTMPKMDGCKVAQQLRQQAAFAATLLIAITGWTDQAHRRLCDEAGFGHYLIKPIDFDYLKNLLLSERRRLDSSAKEVEMTNGTEGAVKKATISRAECVVSS